VARPWFPEFSPREEWLMPWSSVSARTVFRPLLHAALLAAVGVGLLVRASEASERLSRAEAVAEALARNPAIEAALEQVAQARARVSEAKALPDASFVANVTEEEGLLKLGTGTSQDYGLGLTLPFPTKLHLAGRVATANLRAAEFSLAQLKNQTAAQTAQAYDALLVAERHRQDLTDGRALAEDFLRKTEARFQAGTVAKLDVVKAKVDVAQASNDLIANERAIATARAALNRLVGRPPGAPIEAADDLADVPPPLPDVESLAALAASSRPEIRSALVQREGARDATRLAKQYWLPDLNMILARNYTTGSPPAYSSAFSFNVPLFFWQHNNGPIAEAQHREAELEATSRDTAAQVDLDLRASHAAADTARRQALFVRDELLPQAQEAYRIASVSYALGGASALDLLDAKRTLLDAKSQYTDALGAASDARADLERAVGSPLPAGPAGVVPQTGEIHEK
jgi:cobalt-zinc-cadmium efflux system outer membrane protein